jgi:Glycosyl hydrolases family 16
MAFPSLSRFGKGSVLAIAAALVLAVVAWALPSAAAGNTSSTSSDPSGVAMLSVSPPGWRRVFADDFPQDVPLGSFPSAVSASWFAYRDGLNDSGKQGTYMPSKVVSIANGMMNIHVHTEHGVHEVAAVLPIIKGAHGRDGGLLYGRYMIRMRADVIPGYKLGVVLWPDSGVWPKDGEIDFPEADLGKPIHAFVHYQNGVRRDDQAGFVSSAKYAKWHTATITWLPGSVTFELDGHLVGRVRKRIPNSPMHLVIQAETEAGRSVPAASAVGNIQIDWLTIDTRACNSTMSVSPRLAACVKQSPPSPTLQSHGPRRPVPRRPAVAPGPRRSSGRAMGQDGSASSRLPHPRTLRTWS